MAWELTGNAGTNPATNFLGTTDNEPLVITTNGTERLRIDSAGNIGIGTTSPGDLLHIYNNGAAYLRTEANNGAGAFRAFEIGTGSDYHFHIYDQTGGADRLFISWSTGNVGIGTTTPVAKLTVDPQGARGIIIGNPNTVPGGFTNLWLDISAESGGYGILQAVKSTGIEVGKFSTVEYGDLALNPDGGNVGIGTTTPSAKLEVNGDVTVTGDVILTGADCAEEFDIAEAKDVELGTVVVLDQDGLLHQSQYAYDKRVTGVVSGAGDYRPGLILDRQQSQDNRLPVALVGKVYCKVDAQYAPIEVGDLLTTSSTPGHAMKADDPSKAFGSVIGKALRSLEAGKGIIPILIALQ